MADIRGVGVAVEVRDPFATLRVSTPCSCQNKEPGSQFRGISMASTDVARLQLLELLGCAEFVGHCGRMGVALVGTGETRRFKEALLYAPAAPWLGPAWG